MSQTVARRIPIGPVQVYLNATRLGSGRSSAVLNWTYGLAIGQTGDSTTQVNARKINEEATVAVTIADMKASQLRNAMAQARSLATNSLLSTNYLGTTTVSVRRNQILLLTGSGSADGLVSTPVLFTSATMAVYSLDYEIEYTQDTDWVSAAGCDGLYRKTGTAIASGAYVNVHYDGDTVTDRLRVGGADALLESTLRLVGNDAQGKFFQFKAWRVVREGAFNITINDKAEFPGVALTFRLLSDLSNYSKGSQLFEIAIEQ